MKYLVFLLPFLMMGCSHMNPSSARMPANTFAIKSETGSMYIINSATYNTKTDRLTVSLQPVAGTGAIAKSMILIGAVLNHRNIDPVEFARALTFSNITFDCLENGPGGPDERELHFCSKFEVTYYSDGRAR